VTTPLTDDLPSVTAEGVDHLLKAQARDFAQRTSSRTSASGDNSQSFSTGSR
jgi:hypothetical protein